MRRILILSLLLPSLMLAADLRGRIVRSTPGQGAAPAGGVQLALQNNSGQAIGNPVVSGTDGFYYFQSVPAGSYRLIYSYTSRRTAKRVSLTLPVVIGNGKNQDIAQITITD